MMEEIDIGVGVKSVSLDAGLAVRGVAGGVSGRRRTEVDDLMFLKAAMACAYVSSKSSIR